MSRLVSAFVASYGSVDDAEMDYGAIRRLDKVHDVPNYDIALVVKDEKGKVKVHKKEKMTKTGAEIGVLAGVLVGIVVPPVLVIETAGAAVAGGLIGHFARGMDRSTVDRIGDALLEGTAAVVLVDVSDRNEFDPSEVFAHADSVTAHEFDVDTRTLLDAVDVDVAVVEVDVVE